MRFTSITSRDLIRAMAVCAAVGVGAIALLVGGCRHIDPASAAESNTAFGIPGVFKITNETKNVKVTEKRITVGDTTDEVQILLFVLTHSAKGVRLTNPPPEPARP